MKNTTILAIIAIVIVVLGVFFFAGGKSLTGNVISENPSVSQGEVQKVVIGAQGANYYPNEIHVKSGRPVEISLDNSVKGCLRSFTIKDFGIAKYMPNPTDTVTFTPDKKGTYAFACSMGMGYGKIIVE